MLIAVFKIFLFPSETPIPPQIPDLSDEQVASALMDVHDGLSNTLPWDRAIGDGLWSDLNDDGFIDKQDAEAKDIGASEWVRPDDNRCNGRHFLLDFDERPLDVRYDDDIQPFYLQLPDSLPVNATVAFVVSPTDAAVILANADLRKPDPLPTTPSQFHEGQAAGYVHVHAKPTIETFELSVHVESDGNTVFEDTLTFRVAGPLGTPSYFAGARDYLSEPIYPGGPLPKMFIDQVDCFHGEAGEFERFHVTLLPHESTRLSVIETFYDKPFLGKRDRNIGEVAVHNPGHTMIVNGNYFHDAKDYTQHGSRTLGAVVVDGELTEASGSHRWFEAHKEAMLRKNLEWRFDAYSLVQPGNEPGEIALQKEPIEDDRPYIARTADGGMPQAQLGGIHTVHTFVNNVGGNKSHLWFATVEHPTGDPTTLIGFAMTDPHDSTSKFGGPVLRDLLRKSGLTIEEYDPATKAPPGHSDLVYLDGGTSVCIAYDIGRGYEIPIQSARHVIEGNWTRVNNYLAFTVER